MNAKKINQILMDEFHLCGCSEIDEVILTIKKIMDWSCDKIETRQLYSDLIKDLGSFYIIAGILSDLNFIEHGTSVRFSWATPEGIEFQKSLSEISVEDIYNAGDLE